MTDDEILNEVLDREGGYRAEVTRPDGTIDPETVRGVTWPTYKKYCAIKMVPADPAAFLALSAGEAKAIFRELYVEGPGFTAVNIPYEPLRVQLIDFGINSGPATAIRWLQRVMRIDVTGQMDAGTLRCLTGGSVVVAGVFHYTYYSLINDALVAARSYMIDRLVDTGKLRPQDEEGVESRALSFFLAKP